MRANGGEGARASRYHVSKVTVLLTVLYSGNVLPGSVDEFVARSVPV